MAYGHVNSTDDVETNVNMDDVETNVNRWHYSDINSTDDVETNVNSGLRSR